MKKSTLAIAALLTTLSTATIIPAAYAEDVAGTEVTTCQGCKGCEGCTGAEGTEGTTGTTGCDGSKGM
jgi:hypothetical protein